MTQQLAIIELSALAELRAEVAEVRRLLERSHVQQAPEWVTVSDAARRMECSADTIRRRIAAGELESKGAGKARRVRL